MLSVEMLQSLESLLQVTSRFDNETKQIAWKGLQPKAKPNFCSYLGVMPGGVVFPFARSDSSLEVDFWVRGVSKGNALDLHARA